jgi:hypothetical protein
LLLQLSHHDPECYFVVLIQLAYPVVASSQLGLLTNLILVTIL